MSSRWILTFAAFLCACDAKTSSQLKAVNSPIADIKPGTACWANPKVPQLYTYSGSVTDSGDLAQHYVAGFMDQNCQERLVYLDGCNLDGANSMLGFVNHRATTLTGDAWGEFITPETGSYYRLPHLSCITGRHVEVQTPPNVTPETHIIPGWVGYTSLSVKPQLHYVADYSCLKIRRNLAAESYIDMGNAEATTPLSVRDGEEALLLNCGREVPKQNVKAGWNLYSSSDGDLFVARFSAAESAVLPELVFRAVNGKLIRRMKDEEKEQTFADVARKMSMTADPNAKIVWNGEVSQILLDLCTAEDCKEFVPQHVRWIARKSIKIPADELQLKSRIQRDDESLDFLPIEGGKDDRLMSFDRCPTAAVDLTSSLGFTRTVNTDNWFQRADNAGKGSALNEWIRIPCLNRKPVCLIKIDSSKFADLSTTSSSLYQGISTLMRRPDIGTCALASEMEVRISGTVLVKGEPLVLGNLASSIQNPFKEIRVTGESGALVQVDRTCGDCAGSLLPAIELRGNARFRVENLDLASANSPTDFPSIGLSYRGSSGGILAMKNVNIGLSDPAEKGFSIGIALDQGQSYLWNVKTRTRYIGVDANATQLVVHGMTQKQDRIENVMGTSTLTVTGKSSSPALPTTDLPIVESIRALRLNDSSLYIRGVELNGAFGLDLGGLNGSSSAYGIFNRFRNDSGSWATRSSMLFERGAASTTLEWTDVANVGGLIEFSKQNAPQQSKATFTSFRENSWVARNKNIIWNPLGGSVSSFTEHCPAGSWDTSLGTAGGCAL